MKLLIVNIIGKIFGLNPENMSLPSKIFLFLGLGVTGINIVTSINDLHLYKGVDLRIRIVGARAMLQGINPYTLDYSPTLPERLQDPSQYAQGLSRCPYPPSLLLFSAPLAPLPYPVIRGLSLGLEWSAIFVTIALLSRTLRSQRLRRIFVISALIAFSGSYFWRLHLERGQYHIVTTLLTSWGIYEVLKKRQDSWVAGVPFGLALAIRPTVIIILALLFYKKFPKTTIISLGTASLVFFATLPFGGLRFWQDWSSLVKRYENLTAGVESFANLAPIPQKLPVEGYIPKRQLDGKTKNSGVVSIFKGILNQGNIQLAPTQLQFIAKLFLVSLTFLLLLLFIGANDRRSFGLRFTLYAATTLSLIAEFIAPIRYGYADVQLILLIALALPLVCRSKGYLIGLLLIMGFLIGYIPFLNNQYDDRLRTLLLMSANTILYTSVTTKRLIQPTAKPM